MTFSPKCLNTILDVTHIITANDCLLHFRMLSTLSSYWLHKQPFKNIPLVFSLLFLIKIFLFIQLLLKWSHGMTFYIFVVFKSTTTCLLQHFFSQTHFMHFTLYCIDFCFCLWLANVEGNYRCEIH